MRKSIPHWFFVFVSLLLVEQTCFGQPVDSLIQQKFQTALSLTREGNYYRAARIYEIIINDNPSLNRVRLELAKTLFLAGRYLNSRSQFEKVLATKPPITVVKNIQKFLVAIDETLAKQAYFEVEFFFSDFQHQKLKTDYVYLDFFGRPTPFKINEPEEKGNGFRLSSGMGSPYFENAWGAFWAEANLEIFRFSNEKYNSTNLDFWLPFKTRHKTHQFEIGPIFETKNKAMSKYQNGYGLKSRYSFDNQNHFTQIGTSYRSITYSLDAPAKNATQVNFDIAFRPKMTTFLRKYRGELVFYNADEEHESNKSLTVALDTKEILGGALNVSPSLELTRTVYDEVKFPFSNKRKDDLVAVNLALNSHHFKVSGVNFTPKLRIEDSSSTVGIHSYRRLSLSFVLSK